MAENRPYLKYLLWAIIVFFTVILIISSYKQIKRIESQKRLENLNTKIEKPTIKIEPIIDPIIEEIIPDQGVYSILPNLQKEWLDINSDYQGWLSVEGTNIDFPTVRAIDNYYYLDRDFLKKKSELGAIFMDYRNIGNFNDRHTVIYGHYTWNGQMFADLHNYKDENFGRENNIISFNTLYGEKEFKIFSIYVDSAADYTLKLNFEDDLEYENYLKDLKELSLYELTADLAGDKLLITLATCSYEVGNGRLIIHAIEK